MTPTELETRFTKYLRQSKKPCPPAYIKDKRSRLRLLCSILPASVLANLTDSNYTGAFRFVIESRTGHPLRSAYKESNRYKDYVVVLRLLFDMNNNGRKAPRHAYYGGVMRQSGK